MRPTPLGIGAFAGLLVVSAGVAYALGGGRDGKIAPPKPSASASAGASASGRDGVVHAPAPKGVSASDAEEVELRLTHALENARIDVPSLARAEGMLAAHWRRMPLPWVPLTAAARRVTTSLALRTSSDETQWAMPKKDGGTWAPDAKVWNMNEGAFDQRESLFAPTPAQIAFPLTVPPGARFSFAAALVQKTREPVTFTVAVAEGDREKEACTVRVATPQTWNDASCDLGAWAGKSVELRLRTSGGSSLAPKKVAADDEVPALALWGNPTVLVRRRAETPYNVLFVVVDALRPDVIASFHDDARDAKTRAAPRGPLDALLPKVPGLMPTLDGLAKDGVVFTRAWSGGAWTRPGTLSMLGGALSSQIGVDPLPWVVPEPMVKAYYQSEPPLLPLLLRRAHVATRAFVNNYFMVGYAAVGVDMGFERVDDHRHRTRDTKEITESATTWLRANKDARFFAFVNYNSPHEPWEPPDRMMERVPPPCSAKAPADPCGPNEDTPRKYMAEAAKDDEAIGELMKTLGELGLRERTLVVVTADHGETLSAAHAGRSKLDDLQVRFHHAVSNYEETTRIPILMSLPGVLPAGGRVDVPVSNTDIAPTILELLGLPAGAKMTGQSLVPLAMGKAAAPKAPRAIVSEGRGTRAILYGDHRLLLREGGARITTVGSETFTVAEELFDLASDPGERHNLAGAETARVSELRARLDAALKNVATADVAISTPTSAAPPAAPNAGASGMVELRFAGAGRARRVRASISVQGATIAASPVGIAKEAVSGEGAKLDVALVTDPEHVVGVDLKIEPAAAAATLKWDVYVDDQPLAKERFFGGAFGLAETHLEHGLTDERARGAAVAGAAGTPEIDPARDAGLFVTWRGRAPSGALAAGAAEVAAPERATSGAAAAEMNRMLREWGYANKKAPK